MNKPVFGSLTPVPALERPDLLGDPVRAALEATGIEALVAEIDPVHADTETLCATYGVPLGASANAVVVRGTRAGVEKHAVCMTLATHRVDVNGLVRRRLDARKASFAPMGFAVESTGMAHGGITPVGLPAAWPIWVDAAVADTPWLCIGSGVRHSKLFLTSDALLTLPGAERVEDLARPAG